MAEGISKRNIIHCTNILKTFKDYMPGIILNIGNKEQKPCRKILNEAYILGDKADGKQLHVKN